MINPSTGLPFSSKNCLLNPFCFFSTSLLPDKYISRHHHNLILWFLPSEHPVLFVTSHSLTNSQLLPFITLSTISSLSTGTFSSISILLRSSIISSNDLAVAEVLVGVEMLRLLRPATSWKAAVLKCTEQAWAELGQAQLKLELEFNLIFFRFGFIELTGWYSYS